MAVLAAISIIVGLTLGMAPSSVSSAAGSGSTVPCGSPWSPDDGYAQNLDDLSDAIWQERTGLSSNSDYADECENANGARGGWGVALAVLGALTLVGLGLIAAAGGSTPRPAQTS